MGSYRFVDDVALADSAIDVEGRDVADLFATAARALVALMVDPDTVRLTVRRTIELDADTLDLLLHDWLSELIFLKDRDRHAFTEAELDVHGSGPFRLEARVRGGSIESGRTDLRADPKAVTFHQLSVRQVDGGWRARVVIDI